MAGVTWRDGMKVATNVLFDTRKVMLAHLVVTRFCNLDCAYCNEFDKVSKPVPLEKLFERIDRLAALGTQIVTLTGGEPMTHPDHNEIIRRIRSHNMVATTITNGFLMTKASIEGMNEAGLQELQISIDGIKPDAVSIKTLKSLMGRLKLLSQYAKFHVNINSVLGITEERTQDAIEVAEQAKALGFSHTVGVLHDAEGTLAPLSATQRAVYDQLMDKGSLAHRINFMMFQKNLMAGKPNAWKCRAGARYIYVCEDGLVHYCSQQRGHPGIPLADYGVADIVREYRTEKACAPFCTVSCVHQASFPDFWRGKQKAAAAAA